jgi:hypothetical protein
MRNSTARHVLSALALGATLSLGTAAEALADGGRFAATDPVWKAECGGCHVAYPAQLLSASSWRTMMSSLSRHFGTDASLDARSQAHIAMFLERNAGSERRLGAEQPSLKVTETAWFKRKHREVSSAAWSRPAVKSAGNCAACHQDAETGNFDERRIRVPR